MATAKTKKFTSTAKKKSNAHAKRSIPRNTSRDANADHESDFERQAQGPPSIDQVDGAGITATQTIPELENEVNTMKGMFQVSPIEGKETSSYARQIIATLEKERAQNAELRKRIEDIAGSSSLNDGSQSVGMKV